MKKVGVRLFILGVSLAIACIVGLAQPAAKPSGHWEGKIQIPEHELPFSVDLDRNSGGVWIGSIIVQGSTSIDVPLTGLAVEGTTVRFDATLPQKAAFEGHLSADGNSLSGTASNGDGQAPFQLKRAGDAHVKVPAPSSALSPDLEGSWEGTVESDGRVRHVGLKLSRAADGTGAATLIAIDQGNLEIPVATVKIQDKQLLLDAPAISGKYQGTVGSGEITGEWSQGPTRLALTFKKKP